MSARSVRTLIAALAGTMAAHESCAQAYLGLGPSRLSLSSDYSSIDGRSATGFTVFAGYEFVPTWSGELVVSAANIDAGPTQGIFYPADGAEYSILRLSIRKSFPVFAEYRVAPWVGAGTAYHYVNWDTFYYQLDGWGLSLGAGVDFALAQSWLLRAQAMFHRFSAHDTYDEGPFRTRSSELSAAVIYAFR